MIDLKPTVEVKKSALLILCGLFFIFGMWFGQWTYDAKTNQEIQEAGYNTIKNLSCFSNNPSDTQYVIIGNFVTEKENAKNLSGGQNVLIK